MWSDTKSSTSPKLVKILISNLHKVFQNEHHRHSVKFSIAQECLCKGARTPLIAELELGVGHKRDYRIFEEFAYKVIAEAQRCRIVDIFKLNGNIYAFDSTTVDFCLSTFEWALFRKRKGGIKMHTLYYLGIGCTGAFHDFGISSPYLLDVVTIQEGKMADAFHGIWDARDVQTMAESEGVIPYLLQSRAALFRRALWE